MEGAAVVAAEVECLCLHIYVGGIGRDGCHLVGEENRRRVQMLADAIPHHPSQLLYLLFLHVSANSLNLTAPKPICRQLRVWDWRIFRTRVQIVKRAGILHKLCEWRCGFRIEFWAGKYLKRPLHQFIYLKYPSFLILYSKTL